MRNTIGIDFSKDNFDIHRLSDRRHELFGTDKAGLAALLRRIGTAPVRVVYEATGRYHPEPRRVCRRLIDVSYAAMAAVSRAAQKFASASAGGMFPMGSGSRRLLNRSTHSRIAHSTSSKLRHGLRGWMTSALNNLLIVSARALSWLSPTLPTEGSDNGLTASHKAVTGIACNRLSDHAVVSFAWLSGSRSEGTSVSRRQSLGRVSELVKIRWRRNFRVN